MNECYRLELECEEVASKIAEEMQIINRRAGPHPEESSNDCYYCRGLKNDINYLVPLLRNFDKSLNEIEQISENTENSEIRLKCDDLIQKYDIEYKYAEQFLEDLQYREISYQKLHFREMRTDSKAKSFIRWLWKMAKYFSMFAFCVVLLSIFVHSLKDSNSELYDKNLRETFPVHYETLSYLKTRLDGKKVVTLIVGSTNEERIENFLHQYIYLTKHFYECKDFENIIPSTSPVTRKSIFEFAHKHAVSNNDNRIIMTFKDIDLLQNDTPLALQSIAEVDDPKFEKTFAIFTVLLNEMPLKKGDANCKQIIRRHLEEKWADNGLPDGKLAAIMSRISEDCICV